MDYETNTDSDAKHTKTRKDISDAIRQNIQIQTEILEESLTEIIDILTQQTQEQVQQFQAQTRASGQYMTTQDERARQKEIDRIKFEAMQNASTAPSTCRILTNSYREGSKWLPTTHQITLDMLRTGDEYIEFKRMYYGF